MRFLKRKLKKTTSNEPRLKRVRPILGTYVEITLTGTAPEDQLNAWITAGFEAVEEIERLMSRYLPESDLARLNQAEPGVWVTLDPHTVRVLKASNQLFRISKGIFDIRCAAVPPSREPPVELRGTAARKTGPWTFDLGGIAKGYAVDYAVEKIKRLSHGHRITGVVNAGGDLRRWGKGAPPVAVATSAVRTPDSSDRLTAAPHVQMPQGKVLMEQKAVTVFSDRCLWSDALTKVMLMASPSIAERCLVKYQAWAIPL